MYVLYVRTYSTYVHKLNLVRNSFLSLKNHNYKTNHPFFFLMSGSQITFGIDQVKKLYAKKDIDTCFVLRVLDLQEAHTIGWHSFLKHPLQASHEKSTCGFYVLFGGVFGTSKYELLGRHNNADTFLLPSKRAGSISIPCVGRKNGEEPRCVAIDLPGIFILGCNPILETKAV